MCPWLLGFYPPGVGTSELQDWAETWKIGDGEAGGIKNKRQDEFSSPLQVCAVILGATLVISFFLLAVGGDCCVCPPPAPQDLPLQ